MWPFVVGKPAQRVSANRPQCTIVTRSINVTYNVYLNYMVNKVLPAIKTGFPRNHKVDLTINIQHDNTLSHFCDNYPLRLDQVENKVNWDFWLAEQPPNSPDTNILDLGFFLKSKAYNGNKNK
jgi:hypothetical protein